MAAVNELMALLDREIPEGRKNLQENYINLENVAKYCEDNYHKANFAQKPLALQETQNYTTHSLASVAYQINNLATNFMKLLDLQLNQLTDMESSVHHLNQLVMIHKEKVARREIGVMTNNRNVPGPIGMKNGIIYPEQAERPIRYTRKTIDYTILDDVGHGARSSAPQPQGNAPRTARSSSVCSTSSGNTIKSNHSSASKAPSTPIYQVGPVAGSLGRASASHYLTPANVASAAAPPASVKQAFARSNSRQGNSWIENSGASFPPPHDEEDDDGQFMGFEAASPPLPPPPSSDEHDQFSYMGVMPQSHDFHDSRAPPSTRDGRMIGNIQEDIYGTKPDDPYAATGPPLFSQPSMIPQSYIEKVVAIYSYQASKPDELTFNENATIYVVNKNDDGWWEGTMDGQTGLFPYNYVGPCM